jgi:hypothetical protein
MNPLGTKLEGKYVVLSEKCYKSDLEKRILLCKGGFGCYVDTIGIAVVGEYVCSGEHIRVQSFEILRFATQSEIEEAKKLREEIEKVLALSSSQL